MKNQENESQVTDMVQSNDPKFDKDRTLGEQRIRVDFNPGNNDRVKNVKEAYANLIDRLEELRTSRSIDVNGEQNRCIAVAQTELESSCMWAVKAITF